MHADETRVRVLNEKDRKNTTDSFMWVYGTYKGSKFPIRIFEYHPTRNGDHAKNFLKGFSGYLVDALPSDISRPEATLPTQAIEYCKKLFAIEGEIESLSAKERTIQRQEQSKPVLEAFWSWVEINKNKCLPKSKLNKENSIRPFTIGRKNWLFTGSPEGAKASVATYSIIKTAKVNDLNP